MFGEEATHSSTWSKWSASIAAQYQFPLSSGDCVVIDQNNKGFGELGSRIWEAGIVLARYVNKLGPKYFEGKKCIELGSGTGFVGIVAAKQGAHVIVTDKDTLLPLLGHNIKLNFPEGEENIRAAELLWGTQNPFDFPFDVCLGSDLTYDFDDLPVLLDTLKAVTQPVSEVFLAYGEHRVASQKFIEMLNKEFFIEQVPLDADVIANEPYEPFETIRIVKLRKRTERC